MLVKIVIVFLAAMVGIAMLSNLLFPGALRRRLSRQKPPRLTGGATCRACGRPRIGSGPCPCGKA